MGKLLLFAPLLFLPLLLKGKSAYNVADKMAFDLDSVKWRGIKNGAFRFDVKFKFFNPTSDTLKINFLFLDVFIESVFITNITKTNWNFKIEPEAVTYMPLRVEVTFISLFKMINTNLFKSLIVGKMPEYMIFKGHVKIQDSLKFEFDEKQKIIE